MTLSYHKFRITSYMKIRCTVCGASDEIEDARLDDAIEWAEQHECARMRVT